MFASLVRTWISHRLLIVLSSFWDPKPSKEHVKQMKAYALKLNEWSTKLIKDLIVAPMRTRCYCNFHYRRGSNAPHYCICFVLYFVLKAITINNCRQVLGTHSVCNSLCFALPCIDLPCVALCCLVLPCFAMFSIALHCLALHCFAMFCCTFVYLCLAALRCIAPFSPGSFCPKV